MHAHRMVRYVVGAALLGGALLSTGCTATTVGVGFGVAVPSPWGAVPVGVTPVGWYGSPMWYP